MLKINIVWQQSLTRIRIGLAPWIRIPIRIEVKMVDPGRPTHCYCTWRVVCRWEQQCQSSDSPPPFSGWCSLWQGPSTSPANSQPFTIHMGTVFWTSIYYTGYGYFIKIVLGGYFVCCSAQYHAILRLNYLIQCNKPLKKAVWRIRIWIRIRINRIHMFLGLLDTVKSPNFGTAHNFGTAADNFCEALIGFQ